MHKMTEGGWRTNNLIKFFLPAHLMLGDFRVPASGEILGKRLAYLSLFTVDFR